ncbi:MAG: 3'(2'),5'-bisphosphate nucleotidase CysQ [Xanthobacteraceae bacterium]|nr:3'(2'),5'-bisphosphate nucleotidase CysQ [Xanthobacteraceae bacterium]
MAAFDPRAGAGMIDALTAISMSAAAAIRRSGRESGLHIKPDGSPVTAADETAEGVIREGLAQLAPDLPIVSEEHASREKTTIKAPSYFLVDPLDGTREFIAGRDEYTVNIAVVADGAPILGVIAAPALGLMWRGIVGRGAERLKFSEDKASGPEAIHTRARPAGELVVMVSRSHLDAPTQAYLNGLPHTQLIGCGSSVKFCRLAEGAADHYPRLGPTRDWDVAAGHALLVAAGGSVIGPDGTALAYGTPELRIPAFFAWGGPAPTKGALKGGY